MLRSLTFPANLRQRRYFCVVHFLHTPYLSVLNLVYLVIPNTSIHPFRIIGSETGCVGLKTRKLELGTKNLVGARVTQARLARGMKQVELLAQLQLSGIDMSIPALSLLEGQKRPVSDKELCALADVLHVSVDWLLGR